MNNNENQLTLTTKLNTQNVLVYSEQLTLDQELRYLYKLRIDQGLATIDPQVVKTYAVSGRFVDGDNKPLAHVNYTLRLLIEGFVFKIVSGVAADDGTFAIKIDAAQFAWCFLQLEGSRLGFFEFTTLDNETKVPGPVLVSPNLTKDLGSLTLRALKTNFTILSEVFDAEGRRVPGLDVKTRLLSADQQVSQDLEGGKTDADGRWQSAPVQIEYRQRFIVETILTNANTTGILDVNVIDVPAAGGVQQYRQSILFTAGELTTRISGKVVGASGQLVSFGKANFTALVAPLNTSVTLESHIDEKGQFQIQYNVFASQTLSGQLMIAAPGYSPYTQQVTLSNVPAAFQLTNQTFTLAQLSC